MESDPAEEANSHTSSVSIRRSDLSCPDRRRRRCVHHGHLPHQAPWGASAVPTLRPGTLNIGGGAGPGLRRPRLRRPPSRQSRRPQARCRLRLSSRPRAVPGGGADRTPETRLEADAVPVAMARRRVLPAALGPPAGPWVRARRPDLRSPMAFWPTRPNSPPCRPPGEPIRPPATSGRSPTPTWRTARARPRRHPRSRRLIPSSPTRPRGPRHRRRSPLRRRSRPPTPHSRIPAMPRRMTSSPIRPTSRRYRPTTQRPRRNRRRTPSSPIRPLPRRSHPRRSFPIPAIGRPAEPRRPAEPPRG